MFFIKKVILQNYRCFKKKGIDFSNKINIIVGPNAVGKTSVVEAINLLSCCKSHKTNNDKELIKKNEDFYSVKAEVNGENADDIQMIYSSKGKKVLKNEKQFKNLSEYIGYFNCIMFCPEDLKIVKGDPEEKRRFLDLFISQIDKEYLISLMKYKKILKTRNLYLKENDSYDDIYLKILDESLINEAKVIIKKRRNIIEELNDKFNEKVMMISDSKECGKLVYKPNVDVEKIDETFFVKRTVDCVLKTTSCGPHRDDMKIFINDDDGSVYASQGQQRTLALALKLAQADVIKEKRSKIVVVLDDVFGELDLKRQNQLMKLINYDNQIFITTTTIENLSDEIIKVSNIIKIDKDGE